MKLPHNAAVLVADGRKMLFLRNEGDDVHPNLVVEHAEEQSNPKDGDQKSDAPGVSYSSFGSGRNTVEETDFHQLAEDRFAVEATDLLKQRALSNDFESLIVIAPPRTLGELRKHYHKEVSSRLTGEIDKDLTGHPIADIETALQKA
ncbi:MAG: Host attachment protein [Sphingomonas bacterium]|uniref:host attachment family protein n=1 Tax=Sphingomonas bacterium TaxID=1895847 RepID=UPI00262F6963|nr:host attachment family protein [Sphingomonas bacterium]MDB5706874.1 Host attachment protein [Sphingomonas bacterium]